MPDRAQHELRGPVRICLEERSYPAVITADGAKRPEGKYSYQTEFDVEGRLIETRHHNSDGSEWVTRYSYDPSGRLLKFASGKDGGSMTETIHSYDAQGRPVSIASSDAPDNPITFRYDERGRKTKLQISRPEDYRPNMGVAGSPFQAADMRAPNLLGGGSATTAYDELDRPIEVQVRDSQEEPISRAIRIYDEQGRIAEEQRILASPEAIIPPEHRARILKESGISLEELRAQLTKVMGGHAGPHSEAYSYDEAGRIERKLRRVFNEEETIQTTYNEQGDQAIEITRRKQIGEIEQSAAAVRQPEYSEVRYEYEYDDHDNWTRQVVSYRHSLDGEFQFSSERRRTLSYH